MRRTTWATALAVVAVMTAVGCGGDDDAGGADEALDPDADLSTQTLTISNWDAYMPEDLIPAFEEATGVDVTLALHDTNETIVSKLQASDGEGFDLVFVSGQFAQALHEQGLLADLDQDLVPNLANLYPEAMELEHDPGLEYSVPYTWGTTGLCYRSDLVPAEPTSWMDVLDPDPALDGRITALATDRWLLLPAQKALGFSANTTDEDELDEAKELLISSKDHLLAYDDTTFYSRLVSGEAAMTVAWDGWCNYGIAEDPNISFVVPEEGSDLFVDTMVVLASSENKEAAHAFVDWVLEAANQQAVAELVLYKVPNEAAMDGLDPALVEQFPNLGMTPAELLEQEQLLDLGEATTAYTDIVTEVAATG